jgi:hypothetical protein
MVENKILNIYEYWKVPTVNDFDITNFHNVRWLLVVFFALLLL